MSHIELQVKVGPEVIVLTEPEVVEEVKVIATANVGPQGPQGDQGETGADSTVPGPQGIQGETGDQGPQGDPGADSTVPGPQGEQGPQGIQGETGDQGPQGDPGADSTVPGPQGEQGPQGIQGIQGETGAAGVDGDDGAPGATGATGATGAQGSVIPGSLELIYRYTVVGSDKASIDTGVDVPDAGTNDWTNGDLLEIEIVAKGDSAVAALEINMTLNNDATGNYDMNQLIFANNGVAGAPGAVAQNQWILRMNGNTSGGGYPSSINISIPAYMQSTLPKAATALSSQPDTTAASNVIRIYNLGYRGTSAINRLKIIPASGNFKIGTQLLIYKRVASGSAGAIDGGTP